MIEHKGEKLSSALFKQLYIFHVLSLKFGGKSKIFIKYACNQCIAMFELICHERANMSRMLQEGGVSVKISTIRLPRYLCKGTLFLLGGC